MKNQVKTYRDAGLEAKWGSSRSGTPFIFVRNPKAQLKHQRESWWIVDRPLFERMAAVGIVEAFTQNTLLGDVFSIPA